MATPKKEAAKVNKQAIYVKKIFRNREFKSVGKERFGSEKGFISKKNPCFITPYYIIEPVFVDSRIGTFLLLFARKIGKYFLHIIYKSLIISLI